MLLSLQQLKIAIEADVAGVEGVLSQLRLAGRQLVERMARFAGGLRLDAVSLASGFDRWSPLIDLDASRFVPPVSSSRQACYPLSLRSRSRRLRLEAHRDMQPGSEPFRGTGYAFTALPSERRTGS